MSAIAGVFHFDRPDVPEDELSKMSEALAVYGPDSQGLKKQGPYGVIHRLIRFTPEDALERQPLALGPFVLSADIRLDNRDDLERQLGLSSTQARRLPDSGLLLKTYEKWGQACVTHLIGAFAFALWDQRDQTLFLARDQRGRKPLFYHTQTNFFAFASMPKGLLALRQIPKILNETKLAEYLVLNYADHQSTVYQGISRLPPAHTLTVRKSGATLSRYWALDPTRRITLPKDNDYVEQARELLDTVLRANLRSASPVGATLSGGLDSSTIACATAAILQEKGKRLPVYTQVPRTGYDTPPVRFAYSDETPYVEAIKALHPTLDLNYIRSENLSLFDDLEKRFALWEMPQADAFNHIWIDQIQKTAAAQGVRVILTGESGNLGLSYDGLYQLPQWAKNGNWLKLAAALRSIPRHTRYSTARLAKQFIIKPLLPDRFWQWRTKRQLGGYGAWRAYSSINPDFATSVDIDARNAAVNYDPSFRSRTDSRSKRAAILDGVDFNGDLQQMIAASFRTEMRDPMGDLRILEFCLAIPEDQYLRQGKTRWLIRRMMANTLPASVLENPLYGAQMADWHERLDASKSLVQAELQALRNSDSAKRMLDLDRLDSLLANWPKNTWHLGSNPSAYRSCLSRGLVVGKYIRWFEGDNQ